MRASVGDHLVVRSHRVGDVDRHGEVVAVRGPDGGPPFTVRWAPDGHEGVYFPGPDTVVVPARPAQATAGS